MKSQRVQLFHCLIVPCRARTGSLEVKALGRLCNVWECHLRGLLCCFLGEVLLAKWLRQNHLKSRLYRLCNGLFYSNMKVQMVSSSLPANLSPSAAQIFSLFCTGHWFCGLCYSQLQSCRRFVSESFTRLFSQETLLQKRPHHSSEHLPRTLLPTVQCSFAFLNVCPDTDLVWRGAFEKKKRLSRS